MADVTNPLFDGTLSLKIGTSSEMGAGTAHECVSYLLPGLSYSSTNPGGFGDCIFRFASTSPSAAFSVSGHTVAKGDSVKLAHGSGTPVVLFEGTITNDVSHATVEDGFAYYEVTAAGLWWKAGQRRDFCNVWADDDPGQWFELSSGGPFQVDTDGKVEIRLEAGQYAKNGASKALYYWLENGLGDGGSEILTLLCNVQANVSDKDSAAWHAELAQSDSPWGSWTVTDTWANETVSAGTPLRASLYTGAQALRLRMYVDTAASSGTTADRYITLTRLSVVTDLTAPTITSISAANPTTVTTTSAHGLTTGDRIFVDNSASTPSIDGWRSVTVTGASTFTVPVNVTGATTTDCNYYVAARVDEAMADIAGDDAAMTTGLCATTSHQSGGIGNVNWGLNIRPHMSRAEAIEYLAGTHSEPIDYGFWDSAVFYCQERATPASTDDYVVDTTDPGIDFAVYKDTEGTPDVAKVLYRFRDVDGGSSVYPDGTLLAVYRPSAPTWSDASEVVEVWEDWADMVLTEDQAEAIGDQILAWYDANAYSGTITIATPTVPLRAGGTKNTAYIRAGDYIQDSDATIARSMITGFEMDVDSGIATLTIGENRNDFVARIARYEGHQMDRGRSPNGQNRPRRRR